MTSIRESYDRGRRARTPLSVERPWDSVVTAGVLTALIIFVIPLLTIYADLSLTTLFPAAALAYAVVVVATGAYVVGLVSAVFVVGAFSAPMPVFEWAGLTPQGHVMFVDLLMVPLLGWLLYDEVVAGDRDFEAAVRGAFDRPDGRTVATAGLYAFVAWMFLAAVGGSGPSPPTAWTYAGAQVRDALFFTAALLAARRFGPLSVVVPVAFAMAGDLVFAVDEIINGVRGGYRFTYLSAMLGRPPNLPVTITNFTSLTPCCGNGSLYGTLTVGQSRATVGIAVMTVPLVGGLLARAADRTWLAVPLAALGTAATFALALLSVEASQSDAGMMGLFVLLGVVGAYLSYLLLTRLADVRPRTALGALAAPAAGLALYVLAGVLQGREEILSLRTNTLDVRIDQWEAAVRIAAENPLFGLGGDNFQFVSEQYGVGVVGIHNTFFSHLAGGGIPAALFYGASVAAVFWVAARHLAASAGGRQALWAGVATCLLSYHLFSSWSIVYGWATLNAIGWSLAGVVVGAPFATGDATARWTRN